MFHQENFSLNRPRGCKEVNLDTHLSDTPFAIRQTIMTRYIIQLELYFRASLMELTSTLYYRDNDVMTNTLVSNKTQIYHSIVLADSNPTFHNSALFLHELIGTCTQIDWHI